MSLQVDVFNLRHRISNLSGSYFPDCVSKMIVIGQKAHFSVLPVLLAVSYLSHHNVISS